MKALTFIKKILEKKATEIGLRKSCKKTTQRHSFSSRLIPTHSIIQCISLKIVYLAWSSYRSTNNLRQLTFYKSFLNEILIIFGWIQDGGHLWRHHLFKHRYNLQELTTLSTWVVAYESRTTEGLFREEVLTHLLFGRKVIVCHF